MQQAREDEVIVREAPELPNVARALPLGGV